MLNFYQNLPEIINPIAFSVGFFSIRWYSLMYLVGFLIAISLLKWRVSKKETELKWNDILDFLIYSFFGILIGGRLGYVIFYNPIYFAKHPLEIISPINLNGELVGFFGMSYFGAVIGVFLIAYLFTKKRKVDFWKLLDFVLPTVTAGYFFGRIGNFLNGELYGRVTDKWWGMFFANEEFLRHPSQLYEAFLEGFVLFIILWMLRNKFRDKKGIITGIYLAGYGIARFGVEFFREPDECLGFIWNFLTLGQIFAILIMIIGTSLLIILYRNYWKSAIDPTPSIRTKLKNILQ